MTTKEPSAPLDLLIYTAANENQVYSSFLGR